MAIYSLPDLLNSITGKVFQNVLKLITGSATQQALIDVAESSINRVTDASLLGVRDYKSNGRVYSVGEGVFYQGAIYRANATTSGPFDSSKWDSIASGSTIKKTPSDFGANTYIDIAVNGYKNIAVIQNRIQATPLITYNADTNPTSVRIDLSEIPDTDINIKIA